MQNKLKKIWDYNTEDITTHLYLDLIATGPHFKNIRWIINPEFKYKKLVSYINWKKVEVNNASTPEST